MPKTPTENTTNAASSDQTFHHRLRVADLSANGERAFELTPTTEQCRAIANDLGLLGLRKLRFAGTLSPAGKRDWQMTAHLGATVTQECVVTLAPVNTRIEEDVTRQWIQGLVVAPDADEIEMPEDVSQEPLGDVIDLGAVMIEALALALPLYPRADGATLDSQVFAEPGVTPMRDEDARPFAGLASLRDKLAAQSAPDGDVPPKDDKTGDDD